MALASAFSFSLNVVLVRLAYEAGSDPLTVNTVRLVVFAPSVYLYLRFRRVPRRLPPADRALSAALGLMLAGQSLVLLIAFEYIAVGLAVLLFYTYPLMIAAFAWLSGRERASAGRAVAMLVAFGGLALALRAPTGALDWRGAACAAAAAAGMAAILIASERTLQRRDNRVVMLHIMGVAAVVLLAALLASQAPALPVGGAGWLALMGATLFYLTATVCLFTAVGLIGPLRTSVIDTSSPAWSILFALALLDEQLAPSQAVGAALVIAAVAAVQLLYRRGSAAPDSAPEARS